MFDFLGPGTAVRLAYQAISIPRIQILLWHMLQCSPAWRVLWHMLLKMLKANFLFTIVLLLIQIPNLLKWV
jgi:hypothetical protein